MYGKRGVLTIIFSKILLSLYLYSVSITGGVSNDVEVSEEKGRTSEMRGSLGFSKVRSRNQLLPVQVLKSKLTVRYSALS